MTIRDNLIKLIEDKYPNLPNPTFPISMKKVEKAGYSMKNLLIDIENAIISGTDFEQKRKSAQSFLDAMKKIK